MLCNHVCHDLYYGLLQLLLHNEGLCSSPREADSQPTSACCFLLESEKGATDLKQRALGSAFRLRWDISLVVKVLEKAHCLYSEETHVYVLATAGQLWSDSLFLSGKK